MFELNRELNAWCEAVHADRCRADSSIEELKDHLCCEMDRLRSEGMSEEQAFWIATRRLGDAQKLRAEFDKNGSWFSSACRALLRYERSTYRQEGGKMLIGHSLIWAAVMLATPLILSARGAADSYEYIMPLVFLPAWFATQGLLLRALRIRARC